MQVHDNDEVVGIRWLPCGEVTLHPRHRDTTLNGQPVRLLKTNRGEIDPDYLPPVLREPDGISTLTARHVQSGPRLQTRRLVHEKPVWAGAPHQFGVPVPLIPPLAVQRAHRRAP